jgi:hypothetical protein
MWGAFNRPADGAAPPSGIAQLVVGQANRAQLNAGAPGHSPPCGHGGGDLSTQRAGRSIGHDGRAGDSSDPGSRVGSGSETSN